jgi:thiamine kinase-like enzyme
MFKVEGDFERYLKKDVLPQLATPPFGELEGTRLSQKMPVYLVSDRLSQVRIVTKAFQYGAISLHTAWERAEKEFNNLKMVRDKFGMSEGDFRTVAPLGKNKDLSALLVVEYGRGNTLDNYIHNSIHKNETEKLHYKLRLLARFLVKLHGKSESERHPSAEMPHKYLKKLLSSLRNSLLDEKEIEHIKEIAKHWWSRAEVFSDNEVIVHGDATPTNFLFHHEKVTGIDLEKLKYADRCWDLGFLAAELKHNYLNENRSSWDSEPFIRNLLLEYAAGFRDLDMFRSTTQRLPLYMSLGLLRIARNEWLGEKHRRKLVDEAILCLKYSK